MKKALFAFILGLVLGAWLFRDVQPRHPFAARRPHSPASYEEVLGYLGSAAMDKDHYVIVPKRDIRDVAQLAKGDEASLVDAFAVIGKLARQTKMDHYKVVTNSPAEQDVGYLHFHLVKVDPKERKFPFQQKKKEDTTPND